MNLASGIFSTLGGGYYDGARNNLIIPPSVVALPPQVFH
jgi:hypothetical protein